MKKAVNISRDNLLSLGTCIGKFTKSRVFKLTITALDVIAPNAKVQEIGNAYIIACLRVALFLTHHCSIKFG